MCPIEMLFKAFFTLSGVAYEMWSVGIFSTLSACIRAFVLAHPASSLHHIPFLVLFLARR